MKYNSASLCDAEVKPWSSHLVLSGEIFNNSLGFCIVVTNVTVSLLLMIIITKEIMYVGDHNDDCDDNNYCHDKCCSDDYNGCEVDDNNDDHDDCDGSYNGGMMTMAATLNKAPGILTCTCETLTFLFTGRE